MLNRNGINLKKLLSNINDTQMNTGEEEALDNQLLSLTST
jgi:hypothetical protein